MRGDFRERPGILEGDAVRAIDCASLQAYVSLEKSARAARTNGERFALRTVELAAPIRPSRNVFCVGRNYLEHAKEGARAAGRELKLPEVPTFFTKAPTAIAGPDATVHFSSRVSKEYDYEAELAIVIGTRCKDVIERDAAGVIFGFTCLNDLTARDLQRAHLQWFKGKSLDESCPIGPCIVSPDELGDAQALAIELRLNGATMQKSNTSQMIFPIARLIAELSKGMTLEPGDVIATGTPDGVGFARTPPAFLQDGDVVEVDVERIGVLRNRIAIS
jgi:2-keto-4-pentenoate hydratase/2-oxohepta-3-ene-1,7-dioic acid hydratase in catechol pathway